MADDPLLERIRQTVAANRLWPRGASVLVAVSGGVDSLTLLHALEALRSDWALTLRVAHHSRPSQQTTHASLDVRSRSSISASLGGTTG